MLGTTKPRWHNPDFVGKPTFTSSEDVWDASTTKRRRLGGSRRGFTRRSGGACFWAMLVVVTLGFYYFGVGRRSHGHPKGHYSGGSSRVMQGIQDEDVQTTKVFNWTNVHPSHSLEWVSCFRNMECARLLVPIDYAVPEGDTAAIALVKLPSRIPQDQLGYRGPVLFNPGGPGSSGVTLIVALGEQFQKLIGYEYDIVGFDPRGVGFTTPAISVFHSQLEQDAWTSQMAHVPYTNETPHALGANFARAAILGKMAQEDRQVVYAAERVGTPAVARDMLSIVRAYGRERLMYWGLSYGSVLGATFAAMFPDNVERIILDGVSNPHDYYSASWSKDLLDADTVLQTLYQSCVDAGPMLCPLYAPSVSLIDARVERLLHTLQTSPLPYLHHDRTYGTVDSSGVKGALFEALYKPHQMGRTVLAALAALEKGDPQLIIPLLPNQPHAVRCECPESTGKEGECVPTRPLMSGGATTGFLAVACGDSEEVRDGVPELERRFEKMAAVSRFAGYWMRLRIGCSGWKIRAKDKFTSSFKQRTSHPVLIVNTVLDPVTPISNARMLSRDLQGSVVLTQNSPGHCSISATSLCTFKYIRDYFRQGTLPPNGTVCDAQSSVFGNRGALTESSDELGSTLRLTKEEREVLEVSQNLFERFSIKDFIA